MKQVSKSWPTAQHVFLIDAIS